MRWHDDFLVRWIDLLVQLVFFFGGLYLMYVAAFCIVTPPAEVDFVSLSLFVTGILAVANGLHGLAYWPRFGK